MTGISSMSETRAVQATAQAVRPETTTATAPRPEYTPPPLSPTGQRRKAEREARGAAAAQQEPAKPETVTPAPVTDGPVCAPGTGSKTVMQRYQIDGTTARILKMHSLATARSAEEIVNAALCAYLDAHKAERAI